MTVLIDSNSNLLNKFHQLLKIFKEKYNKLLSKRKILQYFSN